MENNFINQNKINESEFASQTGSQQKPIQVENVQYGVRVGRYSSRVAFAFTVAKVSLVVIVIFSIIFLQNLTGKLFGFKEISANNLKSNLFFLISILIPLLPLHIFSVKRLKKLIEENPANLEDLIFKKRIRGFLALEIILGGIILISSIYGLLSTIFIDTGLSSKYKYNLIGEDISNLIFLGGGLVFLALWSYSFNKLTKR